MDITHLTPDAEGSIEWPSFSNDKKAVVTLGAFDGMHLGPSGGDQACGGTRAPA